MNTPAPFYLALFHINDASFCVAGFQAIEDAYAAKELISSSILYEELHEDGSVSKICRNASWTPYSLMPEVLTQFEREMNEDYCDAPIIKWHDVLLGHPPTNAETSATQ